MWVSVVLMLFITPASSGHDSHDSFYYYEDDGDDNTGFEESYDKNVMTMPVFTTTGTKAHTRIRRYQKGNKRPLNPKEIKDIKDVLEDILSNRKVATWVPVLPSTSSHAEHLDGTHRYGLDISTGNSHNVDTIKHTPSIASNRKIITWVPVDGNIVNDYLYSDPVFKQKDRMDKLRQLTKNLVSSNKKSTSPVHTTVPSYISTEYTQKSTDVDLRTLNAQEINKVKEALENIFQNTGASHSFDVKLSTEPYKDIFNTSGHAPITNESATVFGYDSTSMNTDVAQDIGLDTLYWMPTLPNLNSSKNLEALREMKTTTNLTTETGSVTPVLTTEPTIRLDVQGLLDIIANLTYEYDMNLTERFNETLRKYSLPTCPTPTTTETVSTTPSEYNFANTSIVAKCFVCGLDKVEIPRDSFCSDAFAGEFIPLVPVDPRARGQIASYRKYCRYLDVRGYMDNPDEPRAMYGRFTGGCSVRWIDLSGIYTQRTCRNRRRAVMGKHFTSKRMAKLEMALNDVDEGCIISPMATLVPLSRGISLYARFHACVCTGAWCNRTVQNEPWMLNHLILFWYFKFK